MCPSETIVSILKIQKEMKMFLLDSYSHCVNIIHNVYSDDLQESILSFLNIQKVPPTIVPYICLNCHIHHVLFCDQESSYQFSFFYESKDYLT